MHPKQPKKATYIKDSLILDFTYSAFIHAAGKQETTSAIQWTTAAILGDV